MATGEIKALYFADGVVVTAGVSAAQGQPFSVTYDGSETGTKNVDVSSFTSEAERFIWILKNSAGKQILGPEITALNGSVSINTDDMALPAGVYFLVGV
jgi:hypothetical protein